jgi:GLPGLI family protein
MIRLSLFIVIMVFFLPAAAQQATFINSGTIVFERKVNTFAAMEIFLKEMKTMPAEQVYTYMQNYRSSSPQFWTADFELYFDPARTLYQSQSPDLEYPRTFMVPVAYRNKVFNNLESKQTITVKQVFEKSFFVNDTLRNIKWKLTEETREIAGYQCRRANALLFDSIYVVAYYADEIPVKGGPESFNGLPGMILGLAIPHQHITIFAKSISAQHTAPEKLKRPEQGRSEKMNGKEFSAAVAKMLAQFRLTSQWIQVFMSI